MVGGDRLREIFRYDDERRRVVRGVYLIGLPVLIILAGALNLGPALAARDGQGTPGIFTVTSESCPHPTACSWTGTFLPDDPVLAERTDVEFSGGGGPAMGAQMSAVDTGNGDTVYPPGGGGAWVEYVLLLVVGIVFLMVSLWRLVVRPWWQERSQLLGF
jgi:hypothetical protein